MKLGIVIPTAGREDLLLDCLRSIPRSPRVPNHALAVVADDVRLSSEVFAEALPNGRLQGTTLEQFGRRGIAASWNAGLIASFVTGVDAVLVANDDLTFPTSYDWIDDLCRFMEEWPDKMCVCLPDRLTASSLVPHMVPDPAWGRQPWAFVSNLAKLEPPDSPYPEGFEAFSRRFREHCRHKFAPCSMNGAAFVIRREAFEALGGFDKGFGWPGCFEDTSFWLDLLLTYGPARMGTYLGIFVHHLRSASLSFGPRDERQAGIDANRAYFERKWAAHKDVIDWFSIVNALPYGAPWPKYPSALSKFETSTKCTTKQTT